MSSRQIQLELFTQPTLNICKHLKIAMCEDVRASGLSRESVIDRMNDLAERYGVHLSRGNCRRLKLDTFEKWLNPEEPARQIPLKALPVFCAATGGTAAMNVLAQSVGLQVIGHHEQKLLKWAQIDIQRRKLTRQSRKLGQQVGL